MPDFIPGLQLSEAYYRETVRPILDDAFPGLVHAAAQIGYVDEVVPADELLDRAVELGDRLAQRLKFTVAAVKRAAYIGGSLPLERGLHVENAEFLSTLASPGAQEAMLAYMRRTEETGDLPLYDPSIYEQTLEAGSFGRVTGV